MKAKWWILIGVGVAGLTTLGIVGYKKGWFSKKDDADNSGSDSSNSGSSSSGGGSGSSSSGGGSGTQTTTPEKKSSQTAITFLSYINEKAKTVNNKSYSESTRKTAQSGIDNAIKQANGLSIFFTKQADGTYKIA